jgi:RNA polymerase sigma-70 factor (ECF subfamily)
MALMNESLERARSGDHAAFADLVQPHRAELTSHCYRMLGSLQDAEDMVQETLLAAWLALAGFEARSSLRTWLFRIATNRCLNHLRGASRRVPSATDLPAPAPQPSRHGEVPWLQPFPDAMLDGLTDQAPGPEARYESREAISLAFITAAQSLPPVQRAVLLMRDVLGYRAWESADMLGLTEEAVNNALKRARATMRTRPATARTQPTDPDERELLERFVDAFTHDDAASLVALMTDDIWVRMPPHPFEYVGPQAAATFFDSVGAHRLTITRMVPVAVNRQPGWGEYVADPGTGLLHLVGILVVALAGGRISEVTHFEATLGGSLGLPRTIRP